MDEVYNVIVLGMGLKECILSSLLSVDGLKVILDTTLLIHILHKGKIHTEHRMFVLYIQVLHMDRNDYYGGESSSLNLTKLWKRFKGNENPPEHLGISKEYNVNMIPKVIFHQKYAPSISPIQSFLYAESLARFQSASPYIYPLYGLGEHPQVCPIKVPEKILYFGLSLPLKFVMLKNAFARLSAVYGGTYMLNKPECKVEFDENGKAYGVTSEGETAKCKKVVCDPSYLPEKVKKAGKVARAICIMKDPLPDTKDSHSMLITPKETIKAQIRHVGVFYSNNLSMLFHNRYVFCFSYAPNVAPKGKFIAFVSTEAETDKPEIELKPGIDLLGPMETFFDIYDRYEAINNPEVDSCFLTNSYDAISHFETTVQDVLSMYYKINGKELDLLVDLNVASVDEQEAA
ncbi:hypothetical protein PR202_gb25966 [Eleusine coracana subsp. coracana]|uniref:Guanosine nucleotide diphosphate dissociation inhibitor n=1 Tax=Eleusine coracana subsp. coracana TaxID=191504 RepID=A0AAV5FRE2_ELECO|nr:hypothetical protein PR202_gb25966 [Eleusine coracana subsp. coracana]